MHELFADVLDSPAGHIAQLSVASRILHRAEQGQYPDLADAIRSHIPPILDTVAAPGSGTNWDCDLRSQPHMFRSPSGKGKGGTVEGKETFRW